MDCCGNKKDVNRNTTTKSVVKTDNKTHREVRASKVFGADDTVQSSAVTRGFVPIRQTNVGSYSRVTKPEDYAVEDRGGSKSRLIGDKDELNFELDRNPGVANTFDLPTFDYHTLLSHNIYYNLNSKSKIIIEDGNTSRVGYTATR